MQPRTGRNGRGVLYFASAGKVVNVCATGKALVYDFVIELQNNKCVSDATYTRAVRQLGEQGVINLTGSMGYYTTLAMIMNVAQTPPPKGATTGLKKLPG